MKNHLGSYECKLCLTLHNNEVSWMVVNSCWTAFWAWFLYSPFKNLMIMYATISYYFTQTVDMNRVRTCMHNQCMKLSRNLLVSSPGLTSGVCYWSSELRLSGKLTCPRGKWSCVGNSNTVELQSLLISFGGGSWNDFCASKCQL